MAKRIQLVQGGQLENGTFVANPNYKPKAPTAAPTIPISVVENPPAVAPIQPKPVDVTPINQTVGAAQSLLDSFKSEQDAAVSQAQSKSSGSEALVRAYMASLGNQSADQFQMERSEGIPQMKEGYNRLMNRIRIQTDEMNNSDDKAFFDQVNLETDGSSRDVTKGVVGAQQARVARERAIQRVGEAATLRATLATAALMQGDIELAKDNVEKAMSAKYDPIKSALENEKFFLQRYDNQLSDAQKAQSEARQAQLDFQLQTIKDAQDAINDATPFASPQELDAMLKADPQSANQIAQSIIGRVAREDRNLEMQQRLASIRSSNANAALNELDFISKSNDYGSGVVMLDNGEKAVVTQDGTITPVSEIDFNDPAQIDALPVGQLTKAVISGIGKTKDLTPTDKAEVLKDLQSIGFNPNSYILNKLQALAQTWAAMPEDSRGYVQGLKFWQSKTRPEVATFESQKTLLTREIARLFDVGVLSDQDVASYKDAMPSRQDSDLGVVLSKAGGIAGAATGRNIENVGKYFQLLDGRTALVGLDGETLLDPKTGIPLQ